MSTPKPRQRKPVIVVNKEPVQLPPRIAQVDPAKDAPNHLVDILHFYYRAEPFIDQIYDEVKDAAIARGAKVTTGRYALGKVLAGRVSRVIDPVKFYREASKAGLSIQQILSAMSVKKDLAEELLSKQTVDRISTDGRPAAQGMTIEDLEGVEQVDLCDGLNRVGICVRAMANIKQRAAAENARESKAA